MATGDFELPPPAEPAAPARQASFTLRSRGQGEETATQLDPANQSLADALGLVFRLLQVGMVVLLAVFVLSGLQSIKENESGIRLLFGRPSGESLQPGFQFSLPYPIGEMIKVDRGAVQVRVDDHNAFWPRLTEDQKRLSLQQLANSGKFQLKPGEDGSLITGDENLVHTQWRALYQRRDPAQFVARISPESERAIVRAAIQRGVVQAVAQMSIDDLLKQSSEQGLVAVRARDLAQATLDKIGSGLYIELLTLEEKIPPLFLLNDFAGVQSAEQRSLKARVDAESTARNTLTATAGGAYEHLINQIDLYEQALARRDVHELGDIMSSIHALMDGRPVEIGGATVQGAVSGEVTAILNEARRYRSSIVSQRQGQLAAFQAQLAQFRVNPEVVIRGRWADAMTAFLNRDGVEIFNLPRGGEVTELWFNRDIVSMREADRLRKERDTKAQDERRKQDMERQRFRTNTDAQPAAEQ
jgi:regulator of protease activity HflC (stomatin/prohibitin superfamily)